MSKAYELILIPLASDIPSDVRLQALLKTALRRDRFRCRSVKPIEPEEKQRAIKAKKKKRVDQCAVHKRGAAASKRALLSPA